MTAVVTPQRWASDITRLLNAVLGQDRFPIDIPMVAKEFTAQRFPDDPLISVAGDNLPNFDGALFRAPAGRKGWGIIYDVKWGAIGKSLTGGFGTLHLGGETANALRSMALARHDSRRVNNRFGEGTSPRLRQIREGLDALGLKSDTILHHATPRIFYGCELNPGARAALVGLGSPDPCSPSAAAISEAWRRRWLTGRILRGETLDELARLGPDSVRTSLLAEPDAQLSLPID
jgi:hypothetical protein